ncbi:winged helix-turn-helix transcriptional regulator [Enterocloster bolteae]|nr:helix-turn-helix domain-containing protein [Enterocloster bolteae]MCQ5145306.1 helix-turn-helix transcriptional regulator [Enterocloster bolteae]
MPDIKIVSSEIEVTLKVIGGKWKPLILHYLQYGGVKRYNEILRYLGTAPKKTLTAQLRELEEDGIIDRTVIPTLPVQVEYSITEHGKTLFPILSLMCDWGYKNMGDRYQLTHPTCGCEDEEY